MERHCANALKVAQWLSADPRISWVSFPGLEEDKYHALAEKYMPNGTCGVISFGVPGGREKVSAFLDHLKMVSIATHVADARSCTLYRQAPRTVSSPRSSSSKQALALTWCA